MCNTREENAAEMARAEQRENQYDEALDEASYAVLEAFDDLLSPEDKADIGLLVAVNDALSAVMREYLW